MILREHGLLRIQPHLEGTSGTKKRGAPTMVGWCARVGFATAA